VVTAVPTHSIARSLADGVCDGMVTPFISDDGGTALADDEATPCVGGVALPLLESRTRRHARLKVLVCILEEVLQQESTITYGELTAMVSETGPAVRCTSRTPWGEFSDDLFLEGAVPPAKRDVVVTPAKLSSALDHFRHEIRRHDLYMVPFSLRCHRVRCFDVLALMLLWDRSGTRTLLATPSALIHQCNSHALMGLAGQATTKGTLHVPAGQQSQFGGFRRCVAQVKVTVAHHSSSLSK
jgi:hypothetical protein